MTYRQAQALDGQIRKGETGETIVYADRIVRTDSDAATGDQTEQVIPFLKSYTVFNVEQIDGLPERFQLRPAPAPVEDISRDERLEAFFKATCADIRHGGGQAFYAVDRDYVQMPPLENLSEKS